MIALPTLRQLQFFIALVRRQSFSRAADDCLVSQSTLSAAIKELEIVLGAQLVDRTSRNFALTPIGEDIAQRAARLLAEAEDLTRAAAGREPLTGTFHLGVIPTMGPFLLPTLMKKLMKNYPQLKLYLHEDLTAGLIERLQAGQLDMVLMAFPYQLENINTKIIGVDKFVFACAKTHRLAGRKFIKADELEKQDLMLLEDGHCLRDHALSACRLQSKKQAAIFGAASLFTLVQMVRAGLGVTLLPEMALRHGLAKPQDIVALPIKGKPVPHRKIGLAWRNAAGREGDADAFAEILSPLLSPLP
jgi:LysR family transcriptional regulator, hydrogen peroxide-inducible genes activator